jgi:hypothetical protein
MMSDAAVKITLSASRITRWLVCAFVVLVALDVIVLLLGYFLDGHVFGWVPRFNLDFEENVPAFFSTLLLLVASCLLFVIARDRRDHADGHGRHWWFLSLLFFCMAVDEASSIHELMDVPLREALHLSGAFYFSWWVVGFISVIAVTILYLRFFLRLPSETRIGFAVAACVFLAGALGVELLGSYYVSRSGEYDTTYFMIATLEESLEIAGVLIFINALFRYMLATGTGLRIGLRE